MSSRRSFLQTIGTTIAVSSNGWSANDSVAVGVIGLGGRGYDHIREFIRQPNARITALCDVDQAAAEKAQAVVEKASGNRPKLYSDMRHMFTDKSVDVVSMATPNHWHALGTIWAVQAGKDVYVEKPACHNIFEGRMMVEAAAKYQRIVQVGLQSRSIPLKQRAVELLRQGTIGKVYLAKGICYKRRKSIGHKPDSPVPPGVNWDLFLGPAPMRPFNELRFKYNWHWFWDTGNGDIGNNGVHQMDVARWGLGVELPKSVVSTGGKFVYNDDQETPNTQIATFDYGDKELILEVRGLPTGGEAGMQNGWGNLSATVFYGADGYMSLDDSALRVYRGEKLELAIEEKNQIEGTDPHIANFLEAVRSRNQKILHSSIEDGVISSNLCHYANISYRVKRVLYLDSNGNVTDDKDAAAFQTRLYRTPYILPSASQ